MNSTVCIKSVLTIYFTAFSAGSALDTCPKKIYNRLRSLLADISSNKYVKLINKLKIAREKSCDYLLIIYTKNITTTTNFDSARIFSSFN